MSIECEKYETYTLTIDTKFSPSNNSFIAYTNAPIRNIIRAELLSASVSANTVTSNVIYVYAMELDSKFIDRAQIQTSVTSWSNTAPISNVGPIPTGTFSNVNQLRSSIVCFPAEQVSPRSIFTASAYWPAYIDYIEPVRQLQQLTISLYGESGTLLPVTGPTFLNFRFVCAKPNKCLY